MNINHQNSILSIENLIVSYKKNGKMINAVNGVTLSLNPGQTLCLVGESGSGKTTIALSIPFLLPDTAKISGTICLYDANILEMDKKSLYEIRKNKISMIFQDAVGSLIPGTHIGVQLMRAIKFRTGENKKATLISKSKALLEAVGLDDVERILLAYPDELSGGMCQRVMIALALSVEPRLLIADEPISSLDAISQVNILELLLKLQKDIGFSMLFVTHDLRVAPHFDLIGVLREGQLLEYGLSEKLLNTPSSKYLKNLIGAFERIEKVDSAYFDNGGDGHEC